MDRIAACFRASCLCLVAALALTTSAHAQTALQFDGVNDYVTFGTATAQLGASNFTVETWFMRTGAGVATSTGSGGVTSAIPLVAKGRAEADGSNVDCNYFLGIQSTNNVLAADFEDNNTGLNHPVTGSTTIQNNVWYHAAVTFDGTTLRLYLNGILEGSVTSAFPPRFDSIQHASLGSALTSTGVAAGFFQGVLEEPRVWNVARTATQIRDGALVPITSGTGLLGRWGLDEGTGTTATNSVVTSVNGTLTNGPVWVSGGPYAYAYGLRFFGTNGYVTFGDAPAAHLGTFTLETWFRRDGAGTTATTGGVTAVPLIAKGVGEADGSNLDANYFLGIDGTTARLVADFEEGAAGAAPGANHPITGTTTIVNGTWYHAAATYDGTTWKLYLNGSLEATLAVGQPAQSASIQHLGLGAALNSTGVQTGSFNGALDEARIWSVARTAGEIAASVNSQLTAPTANLVARWGADEGAGRVVRDTSGSAVHGTLTPAPVTALWGWVTGAPFNLTLTPPADPTTFAVTAFTYAEARLTWVDVATNETSYEVERSTTGVGGPYTPLATLAANATSYADPGRTSGVEYCYRVRAVNSFGPSAYVGGCITMPAPTPGALDLSGTTYASFGAPASLQLTQVTIEGWIRRDAAGTGTNTGTGGILDLVPIVAKGRAEAEVAAQDINYIFGIQQSTGFLAADFEEGPAGASPSLNHPILGVTPVSFNTWHHVAATYDGNIWKLYLDGALDAQLTVGRPLGSASTVAVALGSALTSTNVAAGFFDGALDEVRVWNVARTQSEINATINSQLSSAASGLVARWSLDEGAGSTINGTAGTLINGSIIGAGSAWTTPAPFNAVVTPPAAPSAFSASPLSATQVQMSWTDNSTDETGFVIERSTTGIGGTYSTLTTTAANATSFTDASLSPSTAYCYRVHAINAFGPSADAGPMCATTDPAPNLAMDLAGSTAVPTYASFGNPASLQLTQFTLEMWLRRDGTGEGTNTGAGGIADAVPLISKGRADAEVAAQDINYLFGIQASTGFLCGDFEEGAAGASPSLNHPILGTTALALDTWYHVAATYDGLAWKLYVNGVLDASLDVGQPLAAASNVAMAMGSALTLAGAPSGYFDGAMDEVRVWNVARTQAEIQSTANIQITTPTAGLVGRWAMDDGSGTVVASSAGTSVNGTLTGANVSWTPGAPFVLAFNQPPAAPVVVAPLAGATNVALSPNLDVSVSDPDGGSLTVTYYGRAVATSAGPDFTLVGLPDTQYYTGALNGGSPAIFDSQTNWIVANRVARNIAYVGQLGDCTEHGDNSGNPIEWQRADASLALLENPLTTGLAEGIPYGVSVGNHDQSPIGNADGTTTFYNQYFGVTRFTGRTYYGGHYGTNNDNWYELFSAGGMDFVVVSLEYDTTPDAAVLAWADGLLTTYSTRKAILLSHFFINTGNPGGWGPQGQATYDALKAHPNLIMMLCGHVPGEGRRSDTFAGNTVHTLLSDYQGRTAGGNGWLRLMEFSPANNVVHVKTFSPWLNQFETDADSQFDLSLPMVTTPAYVALGSVVVPSGSTTSFNWAGRAPNTAYEWYATVSDGAATVSGTSGTFTTGAGAPAPATVNAGSPAGLLTTVNSPVSVPVTISRTVTTPVLGFSVDFTLPAGLGTTAASIVGGGFLAASGASATFQVVDHGAGHFTADGVTLGSPCGSSATSGTLFTIPVTSTLTSGSPQITIDAVSLRDCANDPLTVAIGTSATVTVDRSLPSVTLSSPDGGESWSVGSSHAVTWTATDAEGIATTGITIEYSTNDGASWLPVASALGNSGTYAWTVPATLTSTARVRVTAADANGNLGSDASTAAFTINTTTSTTLGSAPNPSNFGGSVTLTATVTPSTATGSVEFFDGATSLGLGTLSSGVATLATSVLPVGARSLTAVYAGDALHLTSASAVYTHTVQPAASATALASAPNPSAFGESVTLTATVTPSVATGSVEFFDGATSLGSVALVSGTAATSTSALAVGSHALTAVYSGETNYAGSTSPIATQIVNAAATTTALTSAPEPSTFGQSVTLTATVAVVAPGAGSPGGLVTFLDGVTSLGTGTLTAGTASLSTALLAAGAHSLTAVYAGDASFSGSTSAVRSHTVNAASVAVTLVAAPDPGIYQDPVTLTASVLPADATGSVEFRDGVTAIGSSALASGSTALVTSSLSVGVHSLTAAYGGDSNHSPATSAAVSLEVKARLVATAGANGSIAPSGTVLASLGSTPTFTFTADPGYHVASVTVDGGAVAVAPSYTFAAVSANHTIDVQFVVNPPVPAITTLAATTLRTGNGSSGRMRIRVDFDAVPVGSTVEVWRAPYGNSPEYDDGPTPGSTPLVPSYPPGAPWTLTPVTAPGGVDTPSVRDYFHYVAFVQDGFGTRSPASNRSNGALSYALADVSDGFVAGQGDNLVGVADLSLLGSVYGRSLIFGDAFNYLDIGPTTDFSVRGRPTTDNKLDFEDLVMFALDFGVVSVPVASAKPAASSRDELLVDGPAVASVGQEVRARLVMRGTGAVHGASVALGWDPAVVEPVGHGMGEWLERQGGAVFSAAPGVVDVVVLGEDRPGVLGEGEVAYVTFRVLRTGDPAFAIRRVDARDAANHRINVSSSRLPGASHVSTTALGLAFPMPFHDRTTIAFSLATRGLVSLTVHSVDGRLVRTIAHGDREPGEYLLDWDGRDEQGHHVPVGVYYARLATPRASFTRKLTLLR